MEDEFIILTIMTFIEECIKGNCKLRDIDLWISDWHTCDRISGSLHEHLGMTLKEYGLWVENPKYLKTILKERIKGENENI